MRMLTLLLLALFFSPTTALAGADRSIQLLVGEQRVFHLPGLTKISVSGGTAGKVIDVAPLPGNKLIMHGVNPGLTHLPVFYRNRKTEMWAIRVTDDGAGRFRRSCAALLGTADCAGLTVVAAGGKIVLRGRVADLQAYHRVRMIRQAFPDAVLLVDVEPVVLDGLVRAINDEFAGAGLTRAKVTRVGGRLLLEGTVTDELEKRKAEAIVAAMMDDALGSD